MVLPVCCNGDIAAHRFSIMHLGKGAKPLTPDGD